MSKQLKAVYEHGVFRPLEPVELKEHQYVTLSVIDETEPSLEDAPEQSCFKLAQELGLIGVATGMPEDLSTNKAHFESFGYE